MFASLIAIIVVAEGFLVFAFAAALRIEQANMKRLMGFLVGLTGLPIVCVFVPDCAKTFMGLSWESTFDLNIGYWMAGIELLWSSCHNTNYKSMI